VRTDGTLEARGHSATETNPRFFDLDPTGRYLLALGQTSGRMATYRVDAGTGALEPLEVHAVGAAPLWIVFVEQA
jgi:6-phosphogluconolactonase